MDVTSPEIATLGIWTIARFAAIAVLATEALFLYARRRDPRAARRVGDMIAAPEARIVSPYRASNIFWALTPAALLLGLCFWCSVFVSAARSGTGPAPAVAQLGR